MIGQRDDVKVSVPVAVTLSRSGLRFAESVHAPGFTMPLRADPFHKLLFIVAGEAEFHCAGNPVARAPVGSVLIVPAGQEHRLSDVRPATVMLMCFTPQWLRAQSDLRDLWAAATTGKTAVLRLATVTRARAEALWRRSLLEQNYKRAGTQAVLNATATEIVALVGRSPASFREETPAQRIDALVAEIARSFFDAWTIDRAARRSGMSRRSFSAHFRARAGATFWDHLNSVRLTHAARLLERGEHSVLGVMFSCGFNDLSNFYRLFRARYGATPKGWSRAKVRQSASKRSAATQ